MTTTAESNRDLLVSLFGLSGDANEFARQLSARIEAGTASIDPESGAMIAKIIDALTDDGFNERCHSAELKWGR